MRAASKAPRGVLVRGHRPSITAIVVGAVFLLPIGYLGWATFRSAPNSPEVSPPTTSLDRWRDRS